MPDEKATIREFVEENDKLLAVLGIFLGVAAFAVTAQVKIMGQIVAFLFILGALLIWSELFYRFIRPKPPHPSLIFFYLVLSVAFVTTILYWMLEFNNIMRFALIGIVGEVMSMPLRMTQDKSTTWKRLLMHFTVWFFALFVALVLTKNIDRLKNYLLEKQGTTITK